MSPHDPIELELREIRPRGPSAELKRRIVERLESRLPRATNRSWGVALAGSLAAACLAAVSLWWSDDPREHSSNNTGSRVASIADGADLAPTVLAYRHALVRSTDHFRALLDKHAMVTLPHNPARNGIRAFIRPDVEHPSWIGEL